MYGLDIKVNLASSWLKEQMQQVTPGVDFDSDGDININEEVPEEENILSESENIIQENTPNEGETENILPESENIISDQDVSRETSEEPAEESTIEEDIEEIKEDIEEIKDIITDEDPEEKPEEGGQDE